MVEMHHGKFPAVFGTVGIVSHCFGLRNEKKAHLASSYGLKNPDEGEVAFPLTSGATGQRREDPPGSDGPAVSLDGLDILSVVVVAAAGLAV